MIATRLSRVPPFERGLTLGDFLVPIRLGERAAIWQRNLLMIAVGTALIVAGAYVLFAVLALGIAYLKLKRLSGLRKTRETVTGGLGTLRHDDQLPDGQQPEIAARKTG